MPRNILIPNDIFTQNIMTFDFIIVDDSGSMEGEKEVAVRKGLKIIKKQLVEMEETSSTRVCKILFSSRIRPTDLLEVEDLDTDYEAGNSTTHLYDTILYIKEQILRIYNEYCIQKGYRININVIVLSDGQDVGSDSGFSEAADAVSEIRKTTKASMLFYDIGHTNTRIAIELGFVVKGLDDSEESIVNFSQEISQRLVESSQSGTTIENLSKAMMSSSSMATEEYKELMEQTSVNDPLEDLFDYM